MHLESSPGWGGQEIRTLREAKGLRERGFEILFAIEKGGGLVQPARDAGFEVLELSFRKRDAFPLLFRLIALVYSRKIEVLVTHSSLDSWLGGLVGKLLRRRVVRLRHLSTPVKGGVNVRLLYNALPDQVVTTCQEVATTLATQANLPPHRIVSVPTGVREEEICVDDSEVRKFRERVGAAPTDCLVGTLCVLRGWKGVSDLLQAAALLRDESSIKWVVVGGGVSEEAFLKERAELGLEEHVHFTGFVSPPFNALAAFDLFTLLSWAHEGVSQANLQAAWLEKPMVTTPTGGLKEVCIPNETGLIVPPHAPEKVAKAVLTLASDKERRQKMGANARALVEKKFTFRQTLDQMEQIYREGAEPSSLSR